MKKTLIFLMGLATILMLSACSGNTQDLEEELFTEGQILTEQYEKAFNGEDISPDESLADKFQELYDSEEYGETDEAVFVGDVVLVKARYETYVVQHAYENTFGEEGESDITKQEALDHIKQMKEEYGMKK